MLLAKEVLWHFANQFPGAIHPGQARQRSVDPRKWTGGILKKDAIRQVVHEQMQQVALMFQLLFGPKQVGNIRGRPKDVDSAIRID